MPRLFSPRSAVAPATRDDEDHLETLVCRNVTLFGLSLLCTKRCAVVCAHSIAIIKCCATRKLFGILAHTYNDPHYAPQCCCDFDDLHVCWLRPFRSHWPAMKIIKSFASQVQMAITGRRRTAYDERLEIDKKPVFSRAQKRSPWYSLHHFRNQFLVAFAGFTFMFWQFFTDVYWAGNRHNRFEKERTQFLKELDDMEARAAVLASKKQ